MNNLKRNVASEDNIEFGLEFCVQVTHETIIFDFFFVFVLLMASIIRIYFL